ncbi:hypothetical protein [Sinorhizobium fredii]|uniref:hypothetical protein n=1 Tax=Rhizobium fredii TaxID=380 RepID=UPI00359B70F1
MVGFEFVIAYLRTGERRRASRSGGASGQLLFDPIEDFASKKSDPLFAKRDGGWESAFGPQAVDHGFRHTCQRAGLLQRNQGVVIVRSDVSHGAPFLDDGRSPGIVLNDNEKGLAAAMPERLIDVFLDAAPHGGAHADGNSRNFRREGPSRFVPAL